MVVPPLAGFEGEKQFDSAREVVSLYAGSTPAICSQSGAASADAALPGVDASALGYELMILQLSGISGRLLFHTITQPVVHRA